jgi:hypothetical protein
MGALPKWIAILLLLVASACAPLLIVAPAALGREGYEIWILLVIYAYVPALIAKNRSVWLWPVIALCVLSVAAFARDLVKNTATPEFEVWLSLAGWANLLSWALAVGSRFAGRFGRMDISGFGLRRLILGCASTRHDRSSHRGTG